MSVEDTVEFATTNNIPPDELIPGDITEDYRLFRERYISPERVMFYEWKPGDAVPIGGQKWLLEALTGDWKDVNTGRLLCIRHTILPAHPENPTDALQPSIEWLWPALRAAA